MPKTLAGRLYLLSREHERDIRPKRMIRNMLAVSRLMGFCLHDWQVSAGYFQAVAIIEKPPPLRPFLVILAGLLDGERGDSQDA